MPALRGCTAQPVASQPADSVDSRFVAANTKFAFDLFREILDEKPSRNIFISPASVSMALAMTYNGAGGETRRAMVKALGLEGLDLAEVNRANAALKSILENPGPGVKLTTANSLWTNAGNWEEWLSRFRETQGRIVMPRFKYEDNRLLNDALKALGMGIIFDSHRADFSNMHSAPPYLFVNYVRHKTFIEVNEEGTEAAAATAVAVLTNERRC